MVSSASFIVLTSISFTVTLKLAANNNDYFTVQRQRTLIRLLNKNKHGLALQTQVRAAGVGVC